MFQIVHEHILYKHKLDLYDIMYDGTLSIRQNQNMTQRNVWYVRAKCAIKVQLCAIRPCSSPSV